MQYDDIILNTLIKCRSRKHEKQTNQHNLNEDA